MFLVCFVVTHKNTKRYGRKDKVVATRRCFKPDGFLPPDDAVHGKRDRGAAPASDDVAEGRLLEQRDAAHGPKPLPLPTARAPPAPVLLPEATRHIGVESFDAQRPLLPPSVGSPLRQLGPAGPPARRQLASGAATRHRFGGSARRDLRSSTLID